MTTLMPIKIVMVMIKIISNYIYVVNSEVLSCGE